METSFEGLLNDEQRRIWSTLNHPYDIQAFLDSIPYSAEEKNRTPLQVIQDRLANCLDGGLFAAAALKQLGYPPVLVDLLPEPGLDDDHVLAIFRRNGRYGCLAKSNFVGLRSREPVYHSLRELIMSYFEMFFNVNGKKTLRAYTSPLRLSRYDSAGWMWNEQILEIIEERLTKLHQFPIITQVMAAELWDMDPLTYRAGLLVANPAGLYKPKAS